MFSGIIQDLGEILSVEKKEGGSIFIIKTGFDKEINIGDSISVNGVCLTVVDFKDDKLHFNVVNETINRSSLMNIDIGKHVNLEKSLKYNENISGHLVQGHVEGLGVILNIKHIGTEEVRFSIRIDKDLIKYCIYKGSVCIDGISLTIADLNENIIDIAIIPHTYKNTNLSFKKVNDIVNIETDMIAKYVENILISKENN